MRQDRIYSRCCPIESVESVAVQNTAVHEIS
jgi:hypothetical protein